MQLYNRPSIYNYTESKHRGISMKIKLDISSEVIANMMTSAMESGDPVTTAARGGWCDGIFVLEGGSNHENWYADPKTYDWPFVIKIVEVDDERTGHTIPHLVRQKDMARGLIIMASKYPHVFKNVLNGDTDAPCADIFLQCTVFGKEKYA